MRALCLTKVWNCREVEAELPFMGQEAPRPSTRPRWIDADEAMLKLLAIRQALLPQASMRNCCSISSWKSACVLAGLLTGDKTSHVYRGDLEVIRTMADQVHRREKQRRRELLQWREDWHAVLSLDPAEALENLPKRPCQQSPLQTGSPAWPTGLPCRQPGRPAPSLEPR